MKKFVLTSVAIALSLPVMAMAQEAEPMDTIMPQSLEDGTRPAAPIGKGEIGKGPIVDGKGKGKGCEPGKGKGKGEDCEEEKCGTPGNPPCLPPSGPGSILALGVIGAAGYLTYRRATTAQPFAMEEEQI